MSQIRWNPDRDWLAFKKKDCPECYERWVKKGYIRPITKKEFEKFKKEFRIELL